MGARLWAALAAVSLVLAGGPTAGPEARAASAREDLAAGVGPVTRLPIPRFVSLNAREVNVRRGPGLDYRIDWVFARAGLPVKVIDEHRHWRRIVDHEGADGWIYHALLSGRRTVLVTAPVWLRDRPAGEALAGPCADQPERPAEAAGCAEAGAIARLDACDRRWCRIEAGGRSGWAPRAALWGAD